jgi:hypothetical protein
MHYGPASAARGRGIPLVTACLRLDVDCATMQAEEKQNGMEWLSYHHTKYHVLKEKSPCSHQAPDACVLQRERTTKTDGTL